MKRQHPVALIGYTSKNFWLLLIPLVRGLAALKFDFKALIDGEGWDILNSWVKGAGWDILAVTLIFAIAVEKWYFTFYSIDRMGIQVRSGLIAKRDIRIPAMNISAVTCEENPFTARLGVVRVYIDTDAAEGKKTSADLKLIINRGDRAKLFNALSEEFRTDRNKKNKKGGLNYTYKVSAPSLIAFSLLFSSALSGAVLLVAAVYRGTDIIGDKLEQDLLNAVSNFSDAVYNFNRNITSHITPAGITVCIIIAAGFLFSFGANILRHLNFTASRQGKCIIISSGVVVKRTYIINSRKINIADMRQNLLMKLFGLTSVHVNCTGYGKRKNELPVFVPVCSVRKNGGSNLPHVMDRLLIGFSRSETYISPSAKYVMRFIMPPALLILAVMAVGLGCVMVFPQWVTLIRFLTLLCEVPAVWLLFVKACAYCTNGFNITADSVCAKYCKWYEFHTITVPLDRVAEIRLTQTIFQRMNRSCDIHIFTNSEHIGSHCVRGMPIKEVQEIIRERF